MSVKESPFTVVCLNRLVHRNQGVAGLPPTSLIARGVAVISVDDSVRCDFWVTQKLLISFSGRRCIVSAWPSSRVQVGYVALDEASVKTLGIPRESLATRMTSSTPQSTPSKNARKSNRSSRKSSSKKKPTSAVHRNERVSRDDSRSNCARRRSLRDVDLQGSPMVTTNVDDAVARTLVNVEPITGHVPNAKLVELSRMDTSWVENLTTMKRMSMERVLCTGNLLTWKLLGWEKEAQVCSLLDENSQSVEIARVSESTVLSFSQQKTRNNVGDTFPVFSDFCRIDNRAQELLDVVKAFFAVKLHRSNFIRRGAVVHGPSGTGKTALARAVCQEADLHFEEIHGAAVFIAQENNRAPSSVISSLERAFCRAEMMAPSVVIINDVDVMTRNGASRAGVMARSGDQPEFESESKNICHDIVRFVEKLGNQVFVIATTSDLGSVNPALRKPGRLDYEIEIGTPGAEERCAILRNLSSSARNNGFVAFGEEEGDNLARIAHGCVQADIVSLWNRAVSEAAFRDDQNPIITLLDLQCALSETAPSALREISLEVPSTRWHDVGGQELVKTRLQEAVELPLKRGVQCVLEELGLSPPKGILLYGPPGCSKTLLARAVATESNANFISIRGPELLSKWVGASEKAVRSVFERARAAAPTVVFFDEIDSLASTRDGQAGASAHSRVVAQLLAEMDGIRSNEGSRGERVVVIAATNRPDLLDKALLRPGRIDVQIYVGLPDRIEREAILNVHMRNTPLSDDISIEELSEEQFTGGMSGAELSGLVREAALFAMEHSPEKASCIQRCHFEIALSRLQRRSNGDLLEIYERYRKSTL